MTRLGGPERPPVDRPADVPEGSVLTVLRVPPEMAGMRVDVFVRLHLKDTSRSRANFIVRNSARDLAGNRLRPGSRVTPEQIIALWRPAWDDVEFPREIPVLFVDDHVLVIDKPAGLPVHPSARYYRNTVVKMMGERFPSDHLVLAHRLDRDTSGVLVLARTTAADRGIKKQLERRSGVEKSYLAITWGWPTNDEFRVDLPLETDPTSRLRVTMRVASPGCGLEAATRMVVRERRVRPGSSPVASTNGSPWTTGRYALVQCDLETGRQHQIRVHLAAVGCPVLGDKLYGPDAELHARSSDDTLTEDDRDLLELPRHALHAARMGFHHPITGERIVAEAPLPRDMREFLDRLAPADPCSPSRVC